MTSGGSSGSAAPEGSPAVEDDEASGPAPPFGLILAITVTGIMSNTLVAPAAPDIVGGLGRGPEAVGPLLAAGTAPGMFLAPVIGLLADRFGRRTVLVPCLALFGLAGGLAGLAPSFPVLLGLRLVQGVGSAGLVNLAVVLIGDHWEGTERARRIGRNAAALTASIAVMPPLGGVLTSVGGWRAAFLPYWAALVTAAAVFRWLAPFRPGATSLRAQLRATVPFLRTRSIAGAMALGFSVFILIFGLYLTVLPVHLDLTFGVGPAGRGLALGLPSITSTILALSLGRLRGRFTTAVLVNLGLVLFAAAFGLLAGAGALIFVGVAALLYGAAEGFTVPTLQELVTGAAPASSRGAVVAVFVAVSRAGQTIGPLLAAAGLALAGPRPVLAGGAVLAALLALAVLVGGKSVEKHAGSGRSL